MTKHHLFTAVLGLLAAVVLAPAPLAAGKGKIKVVLIDGQNNHKWRETTPILKKALEDTGRFTVDVSTFTKPDDKPGEVPSVPFPPDLTKYDVLLSNFNAKEPWPEDLRNALEARLRNGDIALVIVHAANNAFPSKWDEYDKMIGMGWRGNSYGDRLIMDDSGKEVRVEKGQGPGAGHGPQHEFKVTVRDPNHPITKGMPAEWLHAKDELYHGMRGPVQNVRLLATAFSDKAAKGTGDHEPMIWTVSYGKGRVFHTPMGHDSNSMRCVGFIATLARGSEWAATGQVTQPLPDNFPTADKVSQVPAK